MLLFDVTDGNLTATRRRSNLPRIDAETGLGLVTDVCLKRATTSAWPTTKARASRKPAKTL